MTIKKQFNKLKENWLLIAVIFVLFLVMSGGISLFSGIGSLTKMSAPMIDFAAEESFRAGGIAIYNDDFAPEEETRIITKTASISSEVKRNTFEEQENKLISIVSSTDSYLLNQNSNKHGEGISSYRTGSYNIKVETQKYDSILTQLKEIGEITSFNENARDITAQYTNTQLEITTEKTRLARYKAMYNEAKEVADKLELNDRIFDQERRIKYMEDSLKNLDQKVDYSNIYISLTEERSNWINISLVKFPDLIRNLVNSFNSLLGFIVILLPWAIAIWLIKLILKKIKK
jgi:hypothetical protein